MLKSLFLLSCYVQKYFSDIAGTTVIVEKALASILLEEFKESHCHHCLHWTPGPVPCHQCSQVSSFRIVFHFSFLPDALFIIGRSYSGMSAKDYFCRWMCLCVGLFLCEITLTACQMDIWDLDIIFIFPPYLGNSTGGILQYAVPGWSLGQLPSIRVRIDRLSSQDQRWPSRIISRADGSQSGQTEDHGRQ